MQERKESEAIFGPAINLAVKKSDKKQKTAAAATAPDADMKEAKTFTPGAGVPQVSTAAGAGAGAAAPLAASTALTNEQRAKIMVCRRID